MKQGQTSHILKDKVLGYKDLRVEAYEFSALLRHDTTYKLIEFLARVQVAEAAHMVEEHGDNQMIQQALAGELETNEQRALQKSVEKSNTRVVTHLFNYRN